ncbi:MAG TPA: S9 family peptidase [Isosphaeraceae bacterium]|nr:S9 family peptidase [Isosphaeraceae bacterium]
MRKQLRLAGMVVGWPLVVLFHSATPLLAGDGKPPLAVDDLYRLESAQSARLAPEGRRLAFVRQWIDADSRNERNALWLVEESRTKARALEPGEPDGRGPVWSPDGKWIAFVSARSRPDGWRQTRLVPPQSELASDIWLIRADGGASIPLAGPEKPYGRVLADPFYGRLAFSPDGRHLAFVADDGTDPQSAQEREADVQVVRPDQGEGYTGYGPAQLWVAHLDPDPKACAAERIERLTNDDVWYADPQWSTDGTLLAVCANKTSDRESVRYSINKNFDIYLIDVATHRIRQVTKGPGPDVCPRFSPDGEALACLSIPRKGSHMDVFNLSLVNLADEQAQARVLFEHHGPAAAAPSLSAPIFPLPDECWADPDHLLYNAALGTETAPRTVDVRTGRGARFEPGSSSAEDRSAPNTLAERLRLQRELTPPSNTLLQERALGETRVVHWQSADGRAVEGVLTVPHESVARAPYKLLVYPHGGPHSRSTNAFNFTAQVFAAKGYAVFEPNFRGSLGYGQESIDADRLDFGGGDMRDILTGIDELVHKQLVDPARQFVYGISYGGFMTSWLVGHTRQFRAAAAQNAVTDLDVMWGTSDIPSWTEWEFGGRPWEVPGAMRDHSPFAHVASVQTPTLILHSRDDRRCPLPMGQMFYRALLSREVPTQMVIYPNEGHGIRQPRHRVDALQRVLAWFDQFDKKD